VVAAEHRFAALLDAALAGQLAEQHQRLVGDPVLREVEEEPGPVGDEALAARLQKEGKESFNKSWEELSKTISDKRGVTAG